MRPGEMQRPAENADPLIRPGVIGESVTTDTIDDRTENGGAFLSNPLNDRFEPRNSSAGAKKRARAERHLPAGIRFAVRIEKDDDIAGG